MRPDLGGPAGWLPPSPMDSSWPGSPGSADPRPRPAEPGDSWRSRPSKPGDPWARRLGAPTSTLSLAAPRSPAHPRRGASHLGHRRPRREPSASRAIRDPIPGAIPIRGQDGHLLADLAQRRSGHGGAGARLRDRGRGLLDSGLLAGSLALFHLNARSKIEAESIHASGLQHQRPFSPSLDRCDRPPRRFRLPESPTWRKGRAAIAVSSTSTVSPSSPASRELTASTRRPPRQRSATAASSARYTGLTPAWTSMPTWTSDVCGASAAARTAGDGIEDDSRAHTRSKPTASAALAWAIRSSKPEPPSRTSPNLTQPPRPAVAAPSPRSVPSGRGTDSG